jgi:hypothetical protein
MAHPAEECDEDSCGNYAEVFRIKDYFEDAIIGSRTAYW